VSGRGGRRLLWALAVLLVLAAGFLTLTRPQRVAASALPPGPRDLANGERLYHVASCGYCHRAAGASAIDPGPPTGGAPFPTPVGTFHPGNLTPDPQTGLGSWTPAQFVDAMVHGTAPDGRHYFPAFPYASFRRMPLTDVLDLHAYLTSLPPVRGAAPRAATMPIAPLAPLEPLARRGVGLWKRLAFTADPLGAGSSAASDVARGEYLVNGPGHCGECHTPRDRLMRSVESRHLAGAPHPAGEGQVPSLRRLVSRRRYADAEDLALALEHGETLGYEKLSSGGMAAIQANLARIPEADRLAIARYLVALD
jgi:mono/diheme cytochrome c family protein